MIFYVSIILELMFMYTDAYIDDEHLDDGDWIESHGSRVVMRFLYVVTCSMIHWPENIGLWFFAHAMIYATLFDPILNIKRGNDLFFVGSTATTDKLLKKHPYLNYIGRPLAFLFTVYLIFYLHDIK